MAGQLGPLMGRFGNLAQGSRESSRMRQLHRSKKPDSPCWRARLLFRPRGAYEHVQPVLPSLHPDR